MKRLLAMMILALATLQIECRAQSVVVGDRLPDLHLRRWLMRVTVNLCKDVLKSPWRKRRVFMEEPLEAPCFEKTEQLALYQEVMVLPEKYRTVLDLYYYEELSTKEIAELLQLRQSAVTTRLYRARALLKQRLGEAWKDE